MWSGRGLHGPEHRVGVKTYLRGQQSGQPTGRCFLIIIEEGDQGHQWRGPCRRCGRLATPGLLFMHIDHREWRGRGPGLRRWLGGRDLIVVDNHQFQLTEIDTGLSEQRARPSQAVGTSLRGGSDRDARHQPSGPPAAMRAGAATASIKPRTRPTWSVSDAGDRIHPATQAAHSAAAACAARAIMQAFSIDSAHATGRS
jgi:hypothetical protein